MYRIFGALAGLGVFFLMTSTLLSIPVPKHSDNAAKILTEKELELLQKEIKFSEFIHIQFVQNTYKKLRNKTTSTQGEAFFKKPNKFRWILKDETWLFDGKNFFHYQPSKKTAVSYGKGAGKNKELQELVDMVLDLKALLIKYKVSEAKKQDKKLHIKLDPVLDGDIVGADVDIDLQKNFVTRVELAFKGGNKTTFLFKDPVFKPLLDNQFVIPKETKVSEGI